LRTRIVKMKTTVSSQQKYAGIVVEYLDEGAFRAGLVVREQERHLAVAGPDGRERMITRDLVMMAHPERHPPREQAAQALAALRAEREELARELDLQLLWEVVQEQARSFTAAELADLFFGRRSTVAASVMLEALLADRLYFTRRHMDFAPRPPDQVERLRVQADRIRSRSEDYRHTQALVREILGGSRVPASPESEALAAELTKYLRNPFTRSRELTQMLQSVAPEVDPAEAAFEVLDRLGAKPHAPRFAFIAGLRTEFPPEALEEAACVQPSARPLDKAGFAITIDDEDTVEVDDALECEPLPDGSLRVRVHIAMVADFVARAGAIDREAASRATTVYLPETTILMLPDRISCDLASLLAGRERPVLTTEAIISPTGDLTATSIRPARIPIARRLSYAEVDRILSAPHSDTEAGPILSRMCEAATNLRERRRMAGALLVHRREAKVRVRDGDIEIRMLEADSPSRILVAEFMVLSNFVAARYAAENRIAIIYRVQPDVSGDAAAQRPRLSLYPEHHAGIGLGYYAQLSSPIRRYADLVMQRQIVAALSGAGGQPYSVEELLTVLAGAENAEASCRELERRAKRYWTLRYLEHHALDEPMLAMAMRDGASAELADYGVRGTLRGAPNLPELTPVLVQIARVDALRGWLSMDYLRPAERATQGAP
jgi:exoribonuclease II